MRRGGIGTLHSPMTMAGESSCKANSIYKRQPKFPSDHAWWHAHLYTTTGRVNAMGPEGNYEAR